MEIRPETDKDYVAIKALNDLAFRGEAEGSIVDKIRSSCEEVISLVAVEEGEVIGHILFTPVATMSGEDQVFGMGLAPMAVLPDYQNRGVGSLLVKEGVRILNEIGCPFVVVLGHPNFYPRFGFEKASSYALRAEWDGVPDEAFMVLFLKEPQELNVSGVVKFRAEFNKAV
ncbi:MAG: N-acetyltransferase [Candidatus Polarisedimenticolaceae bacterium]|nr:N-acetyltransferase [Candidatus Polarisedimenticolaceae bacterium]